MSTFVICYSGTDCYLDQALVLREPKEKDSYNPESGYIPSKAHFLLSQAQQRTSVTVNGCGGPYNQTHDLLPVRLWRIDCERDAEGNQIGDYYSECIKAPKIPEDSASGGSVEINAIAGVAMMLGVTLHLVPKGDLDQVMEYWDPNKSLGYSKDDLAYPLVNTRWNVTPQSTAGAYCLRWSEADNEIITGFLSRFQTVSLLGHSRGGVSCLIASNYLAEWFPKLSLKIVALDPVPGPGDWWPVLTQIPGVPNMEYVGIYAVDETSGGFNGVVPRVKGITQGQGVDATTEIWDPLTPGSDGDSFVSWNESAYTLLYTRGRHATVPGSRSAWGRGESEGNNDAVGASGNLAYAMVLACLGRWGVSLTPCSGDQINTWIASVNSNSAHFAKMRDYNYGPASALGLVNGFLYCNARGISSTSGRNPSAWNYLEAFIERSSDEQVNVQRGLIDDSVYAKYYKTFAGSGKKLAPWSFLPEHIKKVQR